MGQVLKGIGGSICMCKHPLQVRFIPTTARSGVVGRKLQTPLPDVAVAFVSNHIMYQNSHHIGLFWTHFPGIGFNVANSKPTLCVNDLILDLNDKKQTDLKPLRVEEVIAWTMNVLEKMIEDFQRDGHLSFCDRYYKKWLHRWDVDHDIVDVSIKALLT